MSVSLAFQKAIRAHLLASVPVSSIVADRIYDGATLDAQYPYITFGPSDTSPYSDIGDCVQGYDVSIQIDCWCSEQGRMIQARSLADAVTAALRRVDLLLDDPYRLVRIDVTSWVFLESDNITSHGVVTVEAEVAQ